MKCSKCDKEIPENSDFCTYCGSKIDKCKGNKKTMKNIIGIASGFILIICIAIFIINSNSTKVVSDNYLENDSIDEEKNEKEIFDYLCEESCKIFSKTKDSIFLKGTSEHSDMIAIKDLKLGTVDNSSVANYLTTTFLNGDIQDVGINLVLKNDKIDSAFVNVVYAGQYCFLGYNYSSQTKFGGTGLKDMNDYVGQITYKVNCNDYSQVTFFNDQRFDKQYGSRQYFLGEEFNTVDAEGYFTSTLKNGVLSDIEFSRNGVNIDVTDLVSDNEKLIVKFDTEDYNTNLEVTENANNELINSEVIENDNKELTEEEKKFKAKEALDTIHTEIYAGEGADIQQTYLSPISYGITAYYKAYDNNEINYRIEKVVVTNQETGASTEVVHNSEYNSIGSAKVDLIDGINTIIFTFYDNYGNTKQVTKTINKLNF